ncbi:MAG: hypothetical protein AAGI17_08650 [Planctomycetota bacterium]
MPGQGSITRRLKLWRSAVLPSAVSLLVHAGLLAAVVLATVAVTRPEPRDPGAPAVVTLADPVTPRTTPAPTPPRETQRTTAASTPAARRAASTAAREAIDRTIAQTTPRQRTTPDTAPRPAPADPAPTAIPQPPPPVRFAGAAASPAERTVFAVDASGAVVATWPIIADELARALGTLLPTQRAQVILFGPTDTDGNPVTAPIKTDDDGYFRATQANTNAVRRWLESTLPSGRSKPLEGLRAALALDPQAVFLLSRSITRTGPNAQWGLGREQTLAELDRLNPINPATGRRPAVIATIQFIEPDQTGLMTAIAAEHGPPGRQLDTSPVTPSSMQAERAARSTAEPIELSPTDANAISAATNALRAIDLSGATDHALFGFPTETEHSAVNAAATLALNRLREASPPSETADPRLALLRGRAAAILASLEDPGPVRRDLADEAITNLSAVAQLDPAAYALAELSHALAESIRSDRASAIDRLKSLIADAAELTLPDQTIERARLLLTLLIGDAALTNASTNTTNYLALIRAEAQTRVRVERRASSAFAPLLALDTPDAALRLRLAAASAPDLARNSTNPRLLTALADHLAQTDPIAAANLYLDTAERIPDQIEWLIRAADLLEDTDRAQAGALHRRIATDFTSDPRARDAATRALDLLGSTPDLLADLLDAQPSHPLANAWRLERATQLEGARRLAQLREIPLTSDLRKQADALAYATLQELVAANPTTDLQSELADVANRLGLDTAPDIELDLAMSQLDTTPAAARRALVDLIATHPDPDRVRLAIARTDLKLGSTNAAVEALGDLIARSVSPPPETEPGWQLLTDALELLASQTAQQPAVRAHVVRLRLLDPDLGGVTTAARLQRLLRTAD